ncbi:MAG: hypothetical protein JXK94_08025 [Deltaproteobacteria bacterium]|nr:hypothetical protein [Deltaproteobacteria bacterium]
MMKHNKRLRSAILEVVQNQIELNDPPETKATLDRLISEGFSESKAKELIGSVVAAEVFEVLKNSREFDKERFVIALKRLPEIPG